MKIIKTTILLIVLFSCKRTDNKQEQVSNVDSTIFEQWPITFIEDKRDSAFLKKFLPLQRQFDCSQFEKARLVALKSIIDGDEELFKKAASFYSLNEKGEDFLFYAELMARKHNSGIAYYYVYTIYKGFLLDTIDYTLPTYALYNLAKAKEAGFPVEKYAETDLIEDKRGKILSSKYFLDKMKIETSTPKEKQIN